MVETSAWQSCGEVAVSSAIAAAALAQTLAPRWIQLRAKDEHAVAFALTSAGARSAVLSAALSSAPALALPLRHVCVAFALSVLASSSAALFLRIAKARTRQRISALAASVVVGVCATVTQPWSAAIPAVHWI